MSILQQLSEYFVTGDKINTMGRNIYVEIFSNPTQNEINDLKKEYNLIRCAIYNNEIYAWRGDFLHDQAIKVLKQHDNNALWDYRLILDTKSVDEIEVYDENIVGDISAKKIIKKIFPNVEYIISANSGDVIANI